MTPPLPDLERLRGELRDLTLVVASLSGALDLTVERLEALREDVDAGRTPTGRPNTPIPDEQRGLPIPPKRPREPGHAAVREAWGELGLLVPDLGLIETGTGEPPDPDRKPRPRLEQRGRGS